MHQLLVATRNQKKMPGLLVGLKDVPFDIITLNDTHIPKEFVVEEPGSTYEAHAAIKAFTYGKRAGVLTLADDSGIEVDALNGWPGVYSATYLAGSDMDRLNGLLEKMNNIPAGKRGAQYRSVIALYDPENDKIRFAEGLTRGHIVVEPRGDDDFGYNPIFFSDELQQTFGEATFENKVRVSHRTRALDKAREMLLTEFV
jgi:XTP/dITP diphosphohydrolase